MTDSTLKIRNTDRQTVSVCNHSTQAIKHIKRIESTEPIKLVHSAPRIPVGYAYMTESDIDEITERFND